MTTARNLCLPALSAASVLAGLSGFVFPAHSLGTHLLGYLSIVAFGMLLYSAARLADRGDLPGMGEKRTLARKRHHADMERWFEATNLEQLGTCTALWLEGQLMSQPGYADGYGPDPETADLIPTLAKLNRAGFVTYGSQPGVEPTVGSDGQIWTQRAAVEMLVDDANLAALKAAVATTRLRMTFGSAPSRWLARNVDHTNSYPCTWIIDGEVCTHFGTRVHRRYLRSLMYAGCSDEALDAVCNAWQVTIIDPEPGRNDLLWPTLDKLNQQGNYGPDLRKV